MTTENKCVVIIGAEKKRFFVCSEENHTKCKFGDKKCVKRGMLKVDVLNDPFANHFGTKKPVEFYECVRYEAQVDVMRLDNIYDEVKDVGDEPETLF